jgi:hypothetical protein
MSISTLDKFIEPLNCLQKCLFLRKLLRLIGQVCTNGKPVLDSTIEIDLVWLAGITKDAF